MLRRQAIAGAVTTLNTIVAESLDFVAGKLEGADDLHGAIQSLLKEIITDHGAIIFNGNGYSAEWHAEAAARGLPNLKTTPDSLPCLVTDEAVALFEDCEELVDIFGRSFVSTYRAIKQQEFETFMRVISPWEREYLLLNV